MSPTPAILKAPRERGHPMGMDVYGKNPTNEVGQYFRANVWYWRPLWGYVEETYPEIAELVEYAQSNDGDGLDESDAVKLASLIKDDLKNGNVREYEKQYRERISELPMDDCDLCEASGIRTDEVAIQSGMPDKELDADIAIIVGREKGWCNGCNGVGKREPWAASYPFEEEVVAEFAEFLESCGGFEIC